MSSSYDPQLNPNKEIIEPARRKDKLKFVIISLLLILIAIAAFMLWPSNISRQEAQEIAIAHVGGNNSRANPASRDFEQFQRVWSVEVFYDGLVHEVYVSMRTGNVVRVEVDRWD